MTSFDYKPGTRVLFGAGSIEKLPGLARQLEFRRTLLIADRGIVAAGHSGLAADLLEREGIEVIHHHDFGANPDAAMVEAARAFAAGLGIDSMLAVGGGSSMDLAKATNIVLQHGGSIEEFAGYGKCRRTLAPMIAVPTTAGTGSDAQSHAIISRPESHLKMAIGDVQLSFRAAILDPVLTVSQPDVITATAGYDAISHAVESFVTKSRNPISNCFAREAWRLLSQNFERVLTHPSDLEARGAMLAGAHLAGAAIENSMLGATHACANPLTARYDVAHGAAIALMLPHVVRWNEPVAGELYRELDPELAKRLGDFRRAARLPESLEIPPADLDGLAAAAGEQWTGRHNPRPFDAAAAKELYQCVL